MPVASGLDTTISIMKNSTLSHIHYDSTRGQTMALLLAVLDDICVSVSKREVIQYIASRKFFDIQDEDRLPYPSAQSNEPRWHCLIAWARKDCVERGWLFDDERDSWGITRDGRNCHQVNLRKFREGSWKAHLCYLWTPKFKKQIDPSHMPSGKDAVRPWNIYRDVQESNLSRLFAEYSL